MLKIVHLYVCKVQYQSAIFGYRERDAMSDDQLFLKINSNSLHILQQ